MIILYIHPRLHPLGEGGGTALNTNVRVCLKAWFLQGFPSNFPLRSPKDSYVLNMERAYKRAPSSILLALILNSRIRVTVVKHRAPFELVAHLHRINMK